MKVTIVLLSLIFGFLTACASEPKVSADPDKYIFSDLEEVKIINNWKLHGWVEVDENSLIVRTTPKTSYLLILTRPNYDLKRAQGIVVTTTAGSVEARFDSVSTLNKRGIRYPIARIYKLEEGKDQRNEIKARILGE